LNTDGIYNAQSDQVVAIDTVLEQNRGHQGGN